MNDQNKSCFWQSPWGLFALLVLGWIILPTDEVFRDILGPAAHNVRLRAHRAWTALKARSNQFFWVTVIATLASLSLIFLGLDRNDHVLVAFGGLVWALYLLIAWLVAGAVVKALGALTEVSFEIGATGLNAVLAKVGIGKKAEYGVSVPLATSAHRLVRDAFIVPVAAATGIAILALMPHWTVLGGLLVIAMLALASSLISAKVGDSTDDGWRLVKKWYFRVGVGIALLLVLWTFLPLTFGKYVDAGGLDAWLADPTWDIGWIGTMIVVALAGLAVWIVALTKVQNVEVRKKLGEGIPVGIGVVLVLVFLFMGPFSSKVKGYVGKYTDNTAEASELPSKGEAEPTATGSADFPTFERGDAVGLDAPDDVPYVAKRTSRKAKTGDAPAAKPVAAPAETPKPVRRTPEKGDGYDEATALLDAAGL